MRRGFTLIELLVAILVVGIAGALLLPAWVRSIRNDKIARCLSNFQALGKAVEAHRAKHGSGPASTGAAFWSDLLPGASCPFGAPYRGPAKAIEPLAGQVPIAADAVDGHGRGAGGCVLLRDGSCGVARPRDSAWTLAAEMTRP